MAYILWSLWEDSDSCNTSGTSTGWRLGQVLMVEPSPQAFEGDDVITQDIDQRLRHGAKKHAFTHAAQAEDSELLTPKSRFATCLRGSLPVTCLALPFPLQMRKPRCRAGGVWLKATQSANCQPVTRNLAST